MIAAENSDTPYQMIDTNIILRFLLNDNEVMSTKAKNLFERASNGNVKLIICECSFIETVFVLEKVMKFSRDRIVMALRRLLKLNGVFTLISNPVLTMALDFYESSKKPWPDCVIAASAIGNGISDIYSFDHHFDHFEGLKRLEP